MHVKGFSTFILRIFTCRGGFTCSWALCFFFISFKVRVSDFLNDICASQVCVDVITNVIKFLSMFDILSSKFDFVKWIYSPLLLEKDCFFKLCYNRVGLYLYASELCGDFIITTLLWLKKSNAMTCIINICIVLVTHNFSCHQWITKH